MNPLWTPSGRTNTNVDDVHLQGKSPSKSPATSVDLGPQSAGCILDRATRQCPFSMRILDLYSPRGPGDNKLPVTTEITTATTPTTNMENENVSGNFGGSSCCNRRQEEEEYFVTGKVL
jgi:hypothetical protein